jgi:hypothetical protein
VSEYTDDNIDFDFFDEPETREDPGPRRGPRRSGGGPPRRPMRPGAGFTPILRLAGLIAFGILIVVLLVFWVQSCQGASKRNAYRNYMRSVSSIAQSSDQTGRDLNDLLTTPGLKESEVEQKLDSFAQQEKQNLSQAESLRPPGPLREQQRAVLEALQFRVNGLAGLGQAFRSTAAQKLTQASTAGQALAAQAARLSASDVVWEDLFKGPSVVVLRNEGVGGVAVPQSTFLANPDLFTLASLTRVWQRLRGATTGGTPGGLHGTGLEQVKALPQGQVLSTTAENTVTASTNLSFAADVKNTGDNQEVSVRVTLTIQRSPQNIVRHATIDVINPGETKTVTFGDLGQPPFGVKTTVKVDVQPVPGEKNTANNSAAFPVIFSLG